MDKRKELLKYVGDPSQLFGVKKYRFVGGKADGVTAVDVKNGTGLEYTVLADRGLDIAYLTYKGINLSYISKTGIVAPQYCTDINFGFRRNFFAGLLTTCGLRQVGSPCEDEGEVLGQHGIISGTPAEEVCAAANWVDCSDKDCSNGCIEMSVEGKIREAKLFEEHMVLQRKITTYYGENRIFIDDVVINRGFRQEPLMILYHINLGFPLLSDKAYFLSPSISIIPRDDEAVPGINKTNVFQMPTHGYKEQVFYHDMKTDDLGNTFAALVNPEIKIAVAVWFNKKQLCNLTQWKQMGEGDYVLGIEPANCHVEGRAKERARGTLQFIEPGEERHFNLEIEIIDDMARVQELKELIQKDGGQWKGGRC